MVAPYGKFINQRPLHFRVGPFLATRPGDIVWFVSNCSPNNNVSLKKMLLAIILSYCIQIKPYESMFKRLY